MLRSHCGLCTLHVRPYVPLLRVCFATVEGKGRRNMSNVPRGYPRCHQNLQILTNFQMDVQSRNRLQASILDLFKISIEKQVAGAERTVLKIKREKVIIPYFSRLFAEVLISYFFHCEGTHATAHHAVKPSKHGDDFLLECTERPQRICQLLYRSN